VRQRLFTFCSAVSLLLCAAVCVLWVRSYWISDYLQTDPAGAGWKRDTAFSKGGAGYSAGPAGASLAQWYVGSAGGALSIGRCVNRWPPGAEVWLGDDPYRLGIGTRHFRPSFGDGSGFPQHRGSLGFEAVSDFKVFGGVRTFQMAEKQVPHWAIVLPTAVLAVPFVRVLVDRVRLGKRLRVGVCSSCGYDIRATPDRCPECGMIAGG
jgi:hypothetical protein